MVGTVHLLRHPHRRCMLGDQEIQPHGQGEVATSQGRRNQARLRPRWNREAWRKRTSNRERDKASSTENKTIPVWLNSLFNGISCNLLIDLFKDRDTMPVPLVTFGIVILRASLRPVNKILMSHFQNAKSNPLMFKFFYSIGYYSWRVETFLS